MESNKVSKKTLSRLPVYLEYLKALPPQQEQISATVIARALGLGEVQVRKDLAKISDTGRRKTGRSREQLIRDIENYLDFVTETGAVLVGTGKLGQALLGGISLEDKYIITSGRIPMDMIQKVAAIRVPMIVSRSTPTIAAVKVARNAGITLLGFSRENRFNIYSASHRLKGCNFPVSDT